MYPWNNTKSQNQRTLLDTFLGDDFFNFGNTNFIDDYSVRTNVASNDEEYRIDVVAPGLDRDDMGVKIENNHIYISYDSENTDKSELVRYRSFTRYWKLPSDADTASVRAEYKQGILSVFVPRETPANNSIDIDIK
jgi:HSP20 family protein